MPPSMPNPVDPSEELTWAVEALVLQADASLSRLTVLATRASALLVLDQGASTEREMVVSHQEIPGTLARFLGLGPRAERTPWQQTIPPELFAELVGGTPVQAVHAVGELASHLPPSIGDSVRAGGWRAWRINARQVGIVGSKDLWALDTPVQVSLLDISAQGQGELKGVEPREIWKIVSQLGAAPHDIVGSAEGPS